MLDQVFDNFRKASESTLQMQQDLIKKWTSQWPTTSAAAPGTDWAEQAQAFQKQWLESVTEIMTKHREKLDAQYKAGISAIEDAFKVTEAKTPDDYRKMTEELWRKSFETLKTSAETQVHEFEKAVEKWFEMMTKAKVLVQESSPQQVPSPS
jgi:NCAIR mutase (PurE)-related protein